MDLNSIFSTLSQAVGKKLEKVCMASDIGNRQEEELFQGIYLCVVNIMENQVDIYLAFKICIL